MEQRARNETERRIGSVQHAQAMQASSTSAGAFHDSKTVGVSKRVKLRQELEKRRSLSNKQQ